jgi:uncharacterized protein (DUF1501 family)
MPMLRRRTTDGCACGHSSGGGGEPTHQAAGLTRRSFLKRAAVTGAVASAAATGTGSLATRYAFAATPYTGDVLVILSLRGGFDGLSAVVPHGDPDYATWRPSVGIPTNALLPIDSMFGLHPAMQSLKSFWDAGTFGAVQAVGQVNPTRSHFEAMEEMERAAPGSSTRTGWIDRTLGLRDAGTAFQGVQLGSGMAASSFLGPQPELAMWSIDSFGLDAANNVTERQRWQQALRSLHTGSPASIGTPAETTLDALNKAATLKDAGYTPENGAVYPDTGLGHALTDVARLVKADVGLQVACVDYGDWDMHVDMGTADTGWMFDHLTELSDSMAAFATDLGQKLNDVTLMTLTEFGRRVEQNDSNGVEHGHGQAVLLLGGGVDGGKVHGTWPTLAPAALDDGDLAGTTDYRWLLAEALEKRCGASGLSTVFPGIASDRVGAFKQRT